MNMLVKLKDMARAMLRRGADSAPPRIGSLFALVCAALFASVALGDETAGKYMIVDLATGGVTYEEASSVYNYTNDVYKTEKMVFRHVPAGTYYIQGGTKALMANDYWIAIFELTQSQAYRMKDGTNNWGVGSSSSSIATYPLTTTQDMSVTNKRKFSNGLRGMRPSDEDPGGVLGTLTTLAWDGINPMLPPSFDASNAFTARGYVFDLPTEAMWEVATRAMPAGDSSRATWEWFFGTTTNSLPDYAYFDRFSSSVGTVAGKYTKVGSMLPNGWGLFDVYGNAPEMCRDTFLSYGTIVPDQRGSTVSTNYVLRGGNQRANYGSNTRFITPNTHASSALIRGVRLACVPSALRLNAVKDYDWDGDGIADVVVSPPRSQQDEYLWRYQYFSNGSQIDFAVEATDYDDYTFGSDGSMVVPPKPDGWNAVRIVRNGTTSPWLRGPVTIYTNGTYRLGVGGGILTPDGSITNGVVKVEQDTDGDGTPDVTITRMGDGDDAGTITNNGDGSYDVTGKAVIELRDADGVIYVPTNTTVTVGTNGVTTVDDGETVTVVIDHGDGTTTETTVNGPATIGPDGTITPTPAGLDGEATITAWWTTNAQWRLTFTVPEAGLSGKVERLTADKSFSVKFARELADINTAGVDAINHTYGYLDFTIDEAKVEGGNVVVTLTITDERISSGSRMFVKITDPKDR